MVFGLQYSDKGESSANLPSNPTRIVQETTASNEDVLGKLKKQKQLKNEVTSPNSNGETSVSESSKENQKRGGMCTHILLHCFIRSMLLLQLFCLHHFLFPFVFWSQIVCSIVAVLQC